jgi:gamma-glutamyltranspeptidase / glutathione hydrolase
MRCLRTLTLGVVLLLGCQSAATLPAPLTSPVPAPVAAPSAAPAPSAAASSSPSVASPGPTASAPTDPNGVAIGYDGAVSSAEPNASDVGVEILKRGGNAVDAAVAVAFALGVTHPTAGNIGGGGFMVIRLANGEATTIDYREVAPGKAKPNMYVDKLGKVTADSRVGPLAAGIPGVVRGLGLAHKKYGSLPWADLVGPAIRLARDGWQLDRFHADDLAQARERIGKYLLGIEPARATLRAAVEGMLNTVQKPDGSAYVAGDTWRQPALAATLGAIAKSGPDAFYTGPLAEQMAKSVRAMGGIWTAKDLAGYTALEREPVRFTYHGNEIISMPPPSSGGVMLRQILAAADILKLEKLDWDSVERIHLYVEALRRCFADRNQLIADPGFVKIPLEQLLDTSYIEKRMADIDPHHATPSSQVGSGIVSEEKPHTTHFSVVDKNRVAVANTFTLNGEFGALVQIPDTGVTLNDEMDDFTAKVGAPNMFGLVQGPQNAIAPGKRMLSSMSPTLVVKDGQLRAVVGSPGGPTIITTVAQILLQMIDHGRSLEQAVAAVRIHHQWLPDQIVHEAALPPETVKALEALGHKLKSRERIGHANCIEVDPKTKKLVAVADVKRDGGKAAAY